MSKCNGINCMAVNGIGHSRECIKEHEAAYSNIDVVPSCFDRAESSGRKFDNCMFIHTCKKVKPICVNNPIN